ncbi:ATP-binding cassette domain-containing protein [Altererythrobacter xixiisoli]|uniref:ATP-binding cassette domain-containing protein n=1 Tax=Croceibacterium xixiisoli TaxID=1476466 RepID=A0A6I4U035_9SPHN|nr:ABC transporter ATP-binding protein [Croceibacterium xixiisoli]MXP00318.1 ATP-binding cassette domain-containing protein [Croceibacterium xixiisoli]
MTLAAHDLTLQRGHRLLLDAVDLVLAPGELVCLLGPNGAGKSTLIRCLDGIWKPGAGSIHIDGTPLSRIGREELARTIAYVPQQSGETLGLSVAEMVTLGRAAHRHRENGAQRREMVHQVLARFNLQAMAQRPFDALSGGERQRVLIARAVAQDARYMLLDEPTSALDLRHQLETLRTVRRLVDENGIGALTAIHDLSAAARFADRVALLDQGRLVAVGRWQDVLTPARLAAVFGVQAHVGVVEGLPYILPADS